MLMSGDPAGRAILLEALDESRRAGAHRFVSMCCTWLVLGLTRLGRVDEVEPYIDLGVGYADEHEVRVGPPSCGCCGASWRCGVGSSASRTKAAGSSAAAGWARAGVSTSR